KAQRRASFVHRFLTAAAYLARVCRRGREGEAPWRRAGLVPGLNILRFSGNKHCGIFYFAAR
ncbi:MAG: hypothetical protein ACLUTK_09555, partial [[Clostridium] leptum]